MEWLVPSEYVERSLRGGRVLSLALALTVSGCATLQPHVFHYANTSTSTTNNGADDELEQAVLDGNELHRKYLSAVEELSATSAGTGAFTLVMGALGLYRVATQQNALPAGAMGALSYAYGSTMPSAARQKLFLAGAEAVSCAVAAAAPMRWPTDSNSPSGSNAETLGGAMRALSTALDSANKHRSELTPFLTTERYTPPPPQTPKACNGQRPPVCTSRATGGVPESEGMERRCREVRDKFAAICHPKVPTARDRRPNPELEALSKQLDEAIVLAHRRLREGSRVGVQFKLAGAQLVKRLSGIQHAVGLQVVATEPQPAQILAAVQAMRATAYAISGVEAYAEKPSSSGSDKSQLGTAQVSGADGPQEMVRELPIQAFNDAKSSLLQLRAALDKMAQPLAEAEARIRLSNAEASRCNRSSLNPNALRLSPDVDVLKLAPGAVQAFRLAGGTGNHVAKAPVASQGEAGELTRDLAGAFVYKASPKATVGAQITLDFSDGETSHSVTIDVTDTATSALGSATAADGGIDLNKLDSSQLAALLPKGSPPTPAAMAKQVEDCMKRLFKEEDIDVKHLSYDAVRRLLRGECNAK